MDGRQAGARFCDILIQAGLVFLIVFTPVAFGTVEPWSVAVFELLVVVVIVAWLVKMIVAGKPALARTPINIPALLLLIFIGFQLVPLPAGMLKVVSPGTYGLYRAALSDYGTPDAAVSLAGGKEADPAGLARRGSYRPLSVYPHGTVEELLRLIAYLGLFFVVVNAARSREDVGRLVGVLVFVGLALSVFGIVQHFTWNGKIYWFRELRYGGSPFGPYVNRNHFAGYMEMVIPLSIGLVYATAYGSPSLPKGLKGFIRWLGEPRISRAIVHLFGAGIMSAAVFLSLSRGGVASLFFSLVFLWLAMTLRRTRKDQDTKAARRVLVPIILLTAAFVVWIGLDQVLPRLASLSRLEYESVDRRVIWADTVKIVSDHPVLGVGLGDFQHVYPRYRSLAGEEVLTHAHNDYLQTLAEAGIVGFVLFWGSVVLILVRVLTLLGERRDPFVRGVVAGAAAGVVAMMVHSIIDFNLHIPANAAAFFLLLGISYGCVHSGREETERTGFISESNTGKHWKGYALAVLGIVLAVMMAFHVVSLYRAERCCIEADQLMSLTSDERNELILELEKATTAAPSNAKCRSELAASYVRLALAEAVDADRRRMLLSRAEEQYMKAVYLVPSNASYHLSLGWVRFLQGDSLESTEQEFERALLFAPGDVQIKRLITQWRTIFRPGYDSD